MSKKEEHSDENEEDLSYLDEMDSGATPPVFTHSLPPSSSIHRTMGW